jgi:hypothetical protein
VPPAREDTSGGEFGNKMTAQKCGLGITDRMAVPTEQKFVGRFRLGILQDRHLATHNGVGAKIGGNDGNAKPIRNGSNNSPQVRHDKSGFGNDLSGKGVAPKATQDRQVPRVADDRFGGELVEKPPVRRTAAHPLGQRRSSEQHKAPAVQRKSRSCRLRRRRPRFHVRWPAYVQRRRPRRYVETDRRCIRLT